MAINLSLSYNPSASINTYKHELLYMKPSFPNLFLWFFFGFFLPDATLLSATEQCSEHTKDIYRKDIIKS